VLPPNYAPWASFLKFRIRPQAGVATATLTVHAAWLDHLDEYFPDRCDRTPTSVTAVSFGLQLAGYERVKRSTWFFRDLELLPAPEPPGPSAVDPWPWKKA
jgi:hypothetical protein